MCTDGPVRTLVDLALAPEHHRGHGALYGGLNQGRIDVARLRRTLASMPLPRAADGRIVLAADVSPWLAAGRQRLPWPGLLLHVMTLAESSRPARHTPDPPTTRRAPNPVAQAALTPLVEPRSLL